MRFLSCVVMTLVLLATSTSTAHARLTRAWTYQELYDAADLVVIVTSGKTRTLKEQAALPDIQQGKADGTTGPVMGQRVETELQVVTVLKGTALDVKGKASKTVVLHHYAEVPGAGVSINGPTLVSFDPTTKIQYLVFLTRGKDGQYVAVSGQTDPWFSIEELRQRAP